MRITLTLLLFIALTSKGQGLFKPRTLNFGPFKMEIDDKAYHNYAGQLVTSCVAYNVYYITDRKWLGGACGAAAGTAAAFGKEYIYDANNGGVVSGLDVVATIMGTLTQVVIYIVVVAITDHRHKWNHPTYEDLQAKYGNINQP